MRPPTQRSYPQETTDDVGERRGAGGTASIPTELLKAGQAHQGRMRGLAVFDGGRRLLSVSEATWRDDASGYLKLWDTQSAKLLGAYLPHVAKGFSDVRVCPDGQRVILVYSGAGKAEVWALSTLLKD